MRLAREGNGKRPRNFLLAALAFSERSDSPALQTEIAFRLAPVSATLPLRPNARSARPARSTTVRPLEFLR